MSDHLTSIRAGPSPLTGPSFCPASHRLPSVRAGFMPYRGLRLLLTEDLELVQPPAPERTPLSWIRKKYRELRGLDRG